MKTTLILIRHGQTPWNNLKKLQGQKDIPLSPKGIEQAKLVAKRIKDMQITKIYSSSLKRAYQTAKMVAREIKLNIEIEDRLKELAYGVHEGKSWSEVRHFYIKNDSFNNKYKPKKGESNIEFRERVIDGLNSILGKNKGGMVLIVCHAAVLHTLVRYFRDIPPEVDTYYRFPNTSVSIFHFAKGKFSEEIVADASHFE